MRALSVVLLLSVAALSQTGAQPKSKQGAGSACHKLITQLHSRESVTWRIGLSTQNTTIDEQKLKQIEQLGALLEKVNNCAVQTPEQLSIKDWEWAVLEAGSLQSDLDTVSAQIQKAVDQQTLKMNVGTYVDTVKSCNDDYNQLVGKYNTLVRNYNDQRETLIRLSTSPLVLPPVPTFMHCSTFNFGSVGTIDCY
jgi:hypothetical protein